MFWRAVLRSIFPSCPVLWWVRRGSLLLINNKSRIYFNRCFGVQYCGVFFRVVLYFGGSVGGVKIQARSKYKGGFLQYKYTNVQLYLNENIYTRLLRFLYNN